ncbi:MAG: septum formation family protein [Mycobacterium sp.]
MSITSEQQDLETVAFERPAVHQPWWRRLRATSTHRALLLAALGSLLIAGLITAMPGTADDPSRIVAYIDPGPVPSTGARGNETFNHAQAGDCLNWPDNSTPDAASIVSCTEDHRFEVAESVDMRTFPGSEYGPDAAPPSDARIKQIMQEQCQAAVSRYLGTRFDPDGRFVVSMVWSGQKAWQQAGERRMLCGLQLPGPHDQQMAFTGTVAEIDQSKVWPAGTCLGLDTTTNQPNDIPVDCAAPHAMEVTGSVNVGAHFVGDTLPPETEQNAFIKEECTRLTDVYMAPLELRSTTLTLIYSTISLPSWAAGSRQVSCSIGATLGNGGWAALLNVAKGPLLINGQPPIPPPDIPDERLNLPAIPVPEMPTETSEPDYSVLDETQHGGAVTTTEATPAPEQTNTIVTDAPAVPAGVGPPPGVLPSPEVVPVTPGPPDTLPPDTVPSADVPPVQGAPPGPVEPVAPVP